MKRHLKAIDRIPLKWDKKNQIFGLMKKIIVLFSLIITFVGIFLIALPSLLNWTGLAKPVKRYLLSSAEEYLPYSVNLDNFKIGLGTLSFNKVALKSDNRRYSISVNNIRLSYRLTSLILHPSSPLQSLKSITLVNPQIVIRAQKEQPASAKSTDIWQVIQTFVNRLNDKNAIKFVRIENGQVAFHRQTGDSLLIVQHLNGILKAETKDIINIILKGSFLSNQPDQMEISARFNLRNEQSRLLCRFARYDLNGAFLEKFLPIKLTRGQISGWLLMENQHFIPDSLNINGELHFRNFALNYKARNIKNIQFKAVVSNNRLIVDSLSARMGKAFVSGHAWVNDVLKPHLQAKLNLKDLNPDALMASGKAHWYSNATLSGWLNLTAQPRTWRGEVELQKGSIRLASGKTLRDVQLNMHFSKDTLAVKKLFARLDTGNLFNGFGIYEKSSGILAINLHAEHFTASHRIFDRLSQKLHALNVRFKTDTKTGQTTGKWAYFLTAPADTLLQMDGQINGDDKNLRIDLLHSTAADCKAALVVSDYLQNPHIERGELRNFPFEEFTSAEFLHPVLQRMSSDFRLSGPLNRLKLNLNFVDRLNAKNKVELVATLSNLFAAHRELNGLIRLKNITGNTKVEFGDDYFSGNFSFGDQISGNLNIDFTHEQYLNGKVCFNHFNIIQAFSDSVIANNFHFLGNINGKVLLKGDVRNPLVSMDLTGDRFVFNDVGYYQAGLQLFATKDSIAVDSLYIAINNLPVIQGKGIVNLKKRLVEGRFSGQDVDMEQLITTLAPNKIHLSGLAQYDLGIKGSLQQPKLDLSLNVQDGILDRLDFDHLFVHLQNDYVNGGTLFHTKDQLLKIDKIEMSRRDHFQLSGLGQIPLYSTGPIDLFLNFDGDLFGIIPLYQPFFKKGVSNVSLHLALGGTPERLRLSSGLMVINHGELWLRNITPHIENISGVIEKKSGTNQVNFINFMASTGGQTLTINTVRNVKLPDGEVLSPWNFKGLDLDFGVLKMETTGRGVQVHLPGFMKPGDFGRLALSGFKPGEDFYFAGPIKHPRLRGKVTVYDTRLTFPFLEVASASPGQHNVVVDFLQNIDWDLQVDCGGDVVYFREIPAYIDNVNTELFVDKSSPGLHLRGILSNKTFRVSGKFSSSRGRLEYLDQTFRVDYFQAEFTEASPYPFISGQAWTTIRDSIGAVPKTIYLKLYAIDPETHQEKRQGSLENFKFKLVSADPQVGEDQERVLSYLGFSVGNLREKATSVGGAVTDKYIFRPLFRPIERAIERNLGIDFVRINSNIAKNLFYTSIGYGGRNFGRNQPLINPFNTSTPYLFLMSSSEVTLGKYLTQNLYLTYTGQLVSVYDKTKPTFDMNHSFGIEYRFLRNILLEIEYDRELMGYYEIPDQKQYLEDVKIRLRHSFTF